MVMVRKSAWRKNNRREVKNTWERYAAIMAIIALGVGFFAGLKVTKTAMVNNLDNYANEYNMYDYRLISTLGLSDEDIRYFNEEESVTAVGEISVDFIADIDIEKEEKSLALKAHSITNPINNLNVIHGRIPEAGDEIVLDASFFSEDIIGQKVSVSSDNDEDTIELFSYKEYRVVGLADSVNYINYDRGTTSLAGGSIYAFAYLPEDGFDVEYYTGIMVRLGGNLSEARGEVYSHEYNDMISEYEVRLEQDLELRADIRYQEIIQEANDALADAQKEYDEGYEEYLSEKADVESELEDAWSKLEDAKQEIIDNEEKLKEADIQIAEAEKEYREGVNSYEKGLREYEDQKSDALETIENNQKELDANKETLVAAIGQIEDSGELTQQYAMLLASLEQIDAGQRELDEGKNEALLGFAQAEKELSDAKAKLDSGYKEIESNKREIREGWDALDEGKLEYEKGLLEYEEGKIESEEGFAEAEEELADARVKLLDAKKEIEDIPEAKVFVLNRNYNFGYANFDSDSSIVDGIARVLPIFFFLVAALVCSTTMTRMVDEQRTQIGTLKALGYSNGAITGRYMLYSGSAALIGCLIGFILGTKFFPIAIWEAYGMLYGFAPIEYVFDLGLAIISIIVSLLCSAGVTFITCKSELLKMPASLIRPKAPKAGKRVLLERIPLLWKKVSFLHKVSIRNILRNKRRFFMTIIGIAGCTSLIVAALGIRDSIKNIANDQFGTIMVYDYAISFTEKLDKKEMDSFTDTYKEELSECVFVATDEVDIVDGSILKKISVVATDDADITNVIGLYYEGKTIPYPVYNKVILSNKLAEEMDLVEGDFITFHINPTETVDVELGGIFENYMNNYMFMTGETYKVLFEENPQYNNAYAKASNDNIYNLSALLLNDDDVATVSVTNDIRVMVDNMMSSLDSVIWLVFICAGALGFVVIYNLNNINITERSREIATIKVLGFYQNETASYVFRETISLAIIGALFGLGLGKLLHMFIMNKINVEMVSFKEQIFGLSYLIAFVATLALTLLVNLMLKKKIDRINMAESLKSVE